MITRNAREALFTGTLAAVLIAYAAVTLGVSSARPDQYLILLAAYLKLAAKLWFLVAVGALVVALYRARPAPGQPRPSPLQLVARDLRRRWARDRFMSFLAPPLLFAVLFATFNLFKQLALPAAGFGMDPVFAGLDRLLFLGVDPWRVTHALLPGPWATFLIDRAYHGWFLPMSLGVIVCGFLPPAADHLRIRYLTSFVAVWILLGSGLAAALPAAGPCFQPTRIGLLDGFEPLIAHLNAQQAVIAARLPGSGLAALEFQGGLLGLHGTGGVAIGGGISAMPSLHNALAALFAMAAFRLNRRAGWAMSAYAALIWVGSIHLGWHYAIDGPVAVALTWGIWRAAGRYADWLLTDPNPRPAYAYAS